MAKNIFWGRCFIMAIAINKMNTCFDLSLYDAIDRGVVGFYNIGRAGNLSNDYARLPFFARRRGKVKIVADTNNPKVTTRWRFTDEALSPAWRRLVAKLTANRKGKAVSARPDSDDGEMDDGNDANVQNL